MSLWSDFLSNDDLHTLKFNHYFPIYEKHLSRFVNLDVTVLEIGVHQGGSLGLWKKLLGPHATIVGVDIDERCVGAEEDQIFVRVGDQSDPIFLNAIVGEFGPPDIVVDDGSHQMRHVNSTFDHLYPKQPKNSVYLVEDTHWCYWPESGVGSDQNESFIERTKAMMDLLHAHYTRGGIQSTSFTSTTSSIHIYDSVVVFEKGRINRRLSITGSRNLFGQDFDKKDSVEAIMRFVNGETHVKASS